uniref:hypothetical protein n=2 Tax=uncultured Phocaeicola sp. TaxID=990718 RepID=UPI0025AA1B37
VFGQANPAPTADDGIDRFSFDTLPFIEITLATGSGEGDFWFMSVSAHPLFLRIKSISVWASYFKKIPILQCKHTDFFQGIINEV